MSDHSHALNVQGSNKNIEDDIRTKVEKHGENTIKKMDEMREMFGQLILNQNMGKEHEEERHRRRRIPDFDEQFERDFSISSTNFNKKIDL